MKLTETAIKNAEAAEKTVYLWDDELKGFGVRVMPSGTKSYVIFYRHARQKRKATIGRTSEVSLRSARSKAAVMLAQARSGGSDPMQERRDARDAPTISEGVERFLNEWAPERIAIGRISPRTVSEYGRQSKRYIEPKLGRMKVAEVTRRDIERCVYGLPPVTRNRALALLSRLFALFEEWEWVPPYTNPCRRVQRAREEPRDRVLSVEEMGALVAELDQTEAAMAAYKPHVAAIRVAMFTGLRISEVLGIRWEDVDFESGRLTLPSTKTGRRTHHLSAIALEIISNVQSGCDYVFSAALDAPLTYKAVRGAFARICGRAGITDVRLHDLRRSFMTTAAASGMSTHLLRDLLGHKTTLMADRYVRHLGNPVKEARDRTAEIIQAQISGDSADIIELRKHKSA